MDVSFSKGVGNEYVYKVNTKVYDIVKCIENAKFFSYEFVDLILSFFKNEENEVDFDNSCKLLYNYLNVNNLFLVFLIDKCIEESNGLSDINIYDLENSGSSSVVNISKLLELLLYFTYDDSLALSNVFVSQKFYHLLCLFHKKSTIFTNYVLSIYYNVLSNQIFLQNSDMFMMFISQYTEDSNIYIDEALSVIEILTKVLKNNVIVPYELIKNILSIFYSRVHNEYEDKLLELIYIVFYKYENLRVFLASDFFIEKYHLALYSINPDCINNCLILINIMAHFNFMILVENEHFKRVLNLFDHKNVSISHFACEVIYNYITKNKDLCDKLLFFFEEGSLLLFEFDKLCERGNARQFENIFKIYKFILLNCNSGCTLSFLKNTRVFDTLFSFAQINSMVINVGILEILVKLFNDSRNRNVFEKTYNCFINAKGVEYLNEMKHDCIEDYHIYFDMLGDLNVI